MRLNLVLELIDVPGQLLDALKPIGNLGANIVAIIHQRDVKTERGTIPVQITIEGDKQTLDRVMKSIEESDIQLISVDGVLRKEQIITILVGNIVGEDVQNTLAHLNSLEGVRVADLDLKMSDSPENSATKIILEADYGQKKNVLKKIKEIGNQKGFLVINEI
ncbi:MAG: amino acid-binding protein [Methanobacteriaceae archaeon]|jgi:ACT domain-containing protein